MLVNNQMQNLLKYWDALQYTMKNFANTAFKEKRKKDQEREKRLKYSNLFFAIMGMQAPLKK